MRPLAPIARLHHSSQTRTWQRVQEGQPVNFEVRRMQYRDRTTLTTEDSLGASSWRLRDRISCATT